MQGVPRGRSAGLLRPVWRPSVGDGAGVGEASGFARHPEHWVVWGAALAPCDGFGRKACHGQGAGDQSVSTALPKRFRRC